MSGKDMYIGNSKISSTQTEVKGKLIQFENENYYKISNYDTMRPFFMSIVSDSNHWMFISSNGGLSAGRKNSSSALFPYYTDDKITESSGITGSKTIFHVRAKDRTYLWEPFSDRYKGLYNLQRNLYKNSFGNKIVFEEINEDLGLSFRYHWNSSNKYGFVKRSTLHNNSESNLSVSVLDGIQNIMPYGVEPNLQNASSNLVDAYKKSELEADIGLGIYALSAIIVDKAEPSEALKATTVWSSGIEKAKYLVSSLQLDAFRKGQEIKQEIDVRAEKGAYFIHGDIHLTSNAEKNWITVAELNRTKVDLGIISHLIKTEKNLFQLVQEDIAMGSKRLVELNTASDGIQLTADTLRNTRHFSNTLFNIMRGGIFDNNYLIERSDFLEYLQNASIEIFGKNLAHLSEIPEYFDLSFLRKLVDETNRYTFQKACFRVYALKIQQTAWRSKSTLE